MATNTNPARGMRDFLPVDVRRREYVIKIIKAVYESYGFEPLETPAVENLETLMGKYGEEGNQLIFKILKRGEGEKSGEADLALRYDLTVPLARVVANNRNELPKFFKRYQIQPVWRADRPARGRFREFYQCDVDAIGSKSMIVEAELCSAVSEILERLGFNDFVIRINHRQILTGILDAAGIPREKHSDALIALDKIDKIGTEGVVKEFVERSIVAESAKGLFSLYEALNDKNLLQQIGQPSIEKLQQLQKNVIQGDDEINWVFDWFDMIKKKLEMPQSDSQLLQSSNTETIKLKSETEGYFSLVKNLITFKQVGEFIGENSKGRKGLQELLLLSFFVSGKVSKHIKIDPSLARGLSYYTGAIFEINVPDLAGSLGGGGRYDGLIGMFGKEEIPACGFSLGLERILVVMAERGMFPPELNTNAADVLVTIWNEETISESLALANELRGQGLRVFVYPEADKLGKQFKYAASTAIPFVAILGDEERASGRVALKNMQTGRQEAFNREEVAERVKKNV